MQNVFTSDAVTVSIGRRRQYFLLGSNICHRWEFRSRLSACVGLSRSQPAAQEAPFSSAETGLHRVGFGTSTGGELEGGEPSSGTLRAADVPGTR